MNPITDKIKSFVAEASTVKTQPDYRGWHSRLAAYLNAALGAEGNTLVSELGPPINDANWHRARDDQASHLEGYLARKEMVALEQERKIEQAIAPQANASSLRVEPNSNAVFVVHGHDEGAKEATARFLEKLKLETVLLHEKASEGLTIIEKFEAHANVGFAVVLLTPDDVGGEAAPGSIAMAKGVLSHRARQNVVLELGYFTGKLGRGRVCGLFKPGVELPSDLHGVLFIELDAQGGWRMKVAQELLKAKMQIDLQGLLQG